MSEAVVSAEYVALPSVRIQVECPSGTDLHGVGHLIANANAFHDHGQGHEQVLLPLDGSGARPYLVHVRLLVEHRLSLVARWAPAHPPEAFVTWWSPILAALGLSRGELFVDYLLTPYAALPPAGGPGLLPRPHLVAGVAQVARRVLRAHGFQVHGGDLVTDEQATAFKARIAGIALTSPDPYGVATPCSRPRHRWFRRPRVLGGGAR